jgi:hypothetical protein
MTSSVSEVEVAASKVGTLTPISEATITRLRASRSVSMPKMGADSATPSVVAETVKPTPVLEAWKSFVSIGSSGWVQYTPRNAHTPHSITAAAAHGLGTVRSGWERVSNLLEYRIARRVFTLE